MMNKDFISHICALKKAMAQQKLVVFVGAGASIDAGIPRWSQLADELGKDLGIDNKESDPLLIAQIYYNERGQKAYVEKIRDLLQFKKARYNQLHEAIFDLKPRHVLTTNLDDLLEQAISAKGLPYSVVMKDDDLPYAEDNMMIKIHGDLELKNLTLKEEDYLEYSERHPLLETQIKSVFASKIILFVGYSFSDYDLKQIVQRVKRILDSDFQQAYMLTTEKEIHASRKDYLKNKGINLLAFSDAEINDDKNFILEYLSGKNTAKKEYVHRDSRLSEQGNNLFSFLKFIQHYRDFEESLLAENILEQTFRSLNRFSEVKVLRPQFVSKLFPFYSGREYVSAVRGKLAIDNPELYKLLSSAIRIENNKLTFDQVKAAELKIEFTEENQKKAEVIIKKLNNSYIHVIYPGKLGSSTADQHTETKIGLFNESTCNCLLCQYNSRKFDTLLTEVREADVTQTSELDYDLSLAFTNFRVGNFLKAFNQYEEIANKAWKAKRHISYFIAKYNIRRLRHWLLGWKEIKDEQLEKKIREKITDLDLDKLLTQLSNIGENEYNLLKEISSDEQLINAYYKIQPILKKIRSTYDLYKKGGWSHGPSYYHELYEKTVPFYQFHKSNYIINDDFSETQQVFNMIAEGFLASHATEKNYPERLTKLNRLIFDVIVDHLSPHHLDDLLKEYELKELVFDDESLSKIIEVICNCFASAYVENKMVGVQPSDISAQKYTRHFSSLYERINSNHLLIISRVLLTHEQFDRIFKHLCSFLKVESEQFHHSNVKYLFEFIANNKKHVSESQLREIITLCASKEVFYSDGYLFYAVEQVISHNNYTYRLSPDDVSVFINRRHIPWGDISLNHGFDTLWKASDDLLKESFRTLIHKLLSEKFEIYLLRQAAHSGIVDTEDYFTTCLLKISGGGSLDLHENKVGELEPINRSILDFVLLVHEAKRELTLDELSQLGALPPYLEFLLTPEQFDYNQFDTRWFDFMWYNTIISRLISIPTFRMKLEFALKEDFDPTLAKLYFKHIPISTQTMLKVIQ
jgi:hypothetical protein